MTSKRDIVPGRMICPLVDSEVRGKRAHLASEIGAAAADLGRKLAELPKGDTYRVVLSSPTGGSLNLRPDGLYDAFTKAKDGKITAVARLSHVGPNFLSTVNMLAGHAMLVQISSQITALQADVDLLVTQPVVSELGAIKAQVITLQTLQYYGENRREVLLSALADLKKSIGSVTEYASALIKAVPEPPRTNVRRTVWDTSTDTVKALNRAREALGVILVGLQALGEAELLLNEPQAAAAIMLQWITMVRKLDLDRCERLARMIPANNNNERHELFWLRTADALAATEERIRRMLDDDVPLQLTFDCSASDLIDAPRA